MNHRGIVTTLAANASANERQMQALAPPSNFSYGTRRHPLDSWMPGAADTVFPYKNSQQINCLSRK
jgi:hypothetical protein